MQTKKIASRTALAFLIIIALFMTFKSLPIVLYEKGGMKFEPSYLSLSDYIRINANFIPLKSFFDYGSKIAENMINTSIVIRNIAANLIMFIPIGFLLGIVKEKYAKVVGISAAFALFLEAVQLVTKSMTFDIDSVILRTISASIGFLLYLLCAAVIDKITKSALPNTQKRPSAD